MPNSRFSHKTNWDKPVDYVLGPFWMGLQRPHLHMLHPEGFSILKDFDSANFNNLSKQTLVNNRIRAKEVRLIDETGKQIGLLPLEEALSLAKERGLDLIQVTEKLDPPVCKLGNYGKYLYQLEKKERKAGQQKGGQLKEIRLTFGISPHDMETRAKQAKLFLSRGDTVRIVMRLRGREKAMGTFAREKVEKFLEIVRNQIAITIDREPRMEPAGLSLIINKK